MSELGLLEVFGDHAFLRGLGPRYLMLLASGVNPVRFGAGEYLGRDGETAKAFYLIQSGKVTLEMHAPGRGAVPVQTVGPGKVVVGHGWWHGTAGDSTAAPPTPSRPWRLTPNMGLEGDKAVATAPNPANVPPVALAVDPLAPKKDAKPKVPEAKELKFGKERFDQLIDDLLARKKTDQEILDALFLATIAPLPSEAESKSLQKEIAKKKAGNEKETWKDVAHALTNSAEFLRHVGELNPNPIGLPKLQLIPRGLKPRDPNAPGDGPFFDQ